MFVAWKNIVENLGIQKIILFLSYPPSTAIEKLTPRKQKYFYPTPTNLKLSIYRWKMFDFLCCKNFHPYNILLFLYLISVSKHFIFLSTNRLGCHVCTFSLNDLLFIPVQQVYFALLVYIVWKTNCTIIWSSIYL